MAFTTFKGPLLAFGRARATPSTDYNENTPAPSAFDYGAVLSDSRSNFAYQPGQAGPFYVHNSDGPIVDQVPSTAAANNIALTQTPSAGVALVLTAGTGVTAGVKITNQLTGAQVTVLALDGAMGAVNMGTVPNLTYGGGAYMAMWDPTKSLSRAVRVHSVGNDSTATFLVSGFDIYGFPMTQLLTGGSGADAVTTKAFKYILSVTPAGTLSGSAVTVGTSDIFGFPLYVPQFSYCRIFWVVSTTQTIITAVTGFLAGDMTDNPSTNLTGDVRGTYAVQVASNATYRLGMQWYPSVAGRALGVNGIYGLPQV